MQKNQEVRDELLTGKELYQLLKVSEDKVRSSWKDWPHYLVGKKKQIRNARFIYREVLEYLHSKPEKKGRGASTKQKAKKESAPASEPVSTTEPSSTPEETSEPENSSRPESLSGETV